MSEIFQASTGILLFTTMKIILLLIKDVTDVAVCKRLISKTLKLGVNLDFIRF